MKILKKNNSFVAYRDKLDLNVGGINHRIKVGDELGRISIKTGKFVGNTVCLVELQNKRDEFINQSDYGKE